MSARLRVKQVNVTDENRREVIDRRNQIAHYYRHKSNEGGVQRVITTITQGVLF